MIEIIEESMSGVIEMLGRLSAGAGARRRFDAGEMLFASGDPLRNSLLVIESGRLRLLHQALSEKPGL